MSEILNKFALTQFHHLACEVLKKTDSGKLPENMVDMMYQAMTEKVVPVHRVSVRDIIRADIKLPFMPELIDYKIGQGCCDAIIRADCLFTPCSKHCSHGNKCAEHTTEQTKHGSTVYNDYKARYSAWEKKEPYVIVTSTATLTEKPYWAYLHTKKLDSTAVKAELSKWGITIDLDPSLFRGPPKPPRKSRGRKAEMKVTDTEESEESEESEDKSEESEDKSEESEDKSEESDDKSEDATHDSDSEPDEPTDDESKPKVSRRKAAEPKAEEPKPEKPKSEKPKPKPKGKKIGTSLDGELVKEPMEKPEKVPGKVLYRGSKAHLTEVEVDGVTYKECDGKYYDPATLIRAAWTNKKGEFLLL